MKIIAAILLLLSPLILIRADETSKAPAKGAHELSIDDTEAYIRDHKEVTILDVRTLDEYRGEGHLPGAKLLDFLGGDFEKAVKDSKLDPSKPVIVYCAIGGRAKRAADKMIKLGFKDIILPKGSFNGWKAAGKKVEK